ncbi:hypothetical protein ACJX0J_024655, partial [Zea mays]
MGRCYDGVIDGREGTTLILMMHNESVPGILTATSCLIIIYASISGNYLNGYVSNAIHQYIMLRAQHARTLETLVKHIMCLSMYLPYLPATREHLLKIFAAVSQTATAAQDIHSRGKSEGAINMLTHVFGIFEWISDVRLPQVVNNDNLLIHTDVC